MYIYIYVYIRVHFFGLESTGLGKGIERENRVPGFGFRVQVERFRVQGSGFRVQGSGFIVQDVGSGCFRLQGTSPRFPALGFGLALSSERGTYKTVKAILWPWR